MREETILVDNRPVFLRRWGHPDKPKILLLHGFPEYSGAWSDFAPLLADRFHLIAPDLRGFGQSWAPQDIEDVATHRVATEIAELIGDEPMIVMGHDWGAAVAYALAFRWPGLVKRLIVANGVHPVTFQRALATGGAQAEASQYITWLRREGSEAKLAENNFERLRNMFAAHMDMSWFTPDRQSEYIAEWSRPGRLHAMVNWYRASPVVVPPPGQSAPMPQWPENRFVVRCPHLLIWGARDTALLPEATEGLEDFAPDLTRVILEDADHWLLHQAQSEIARIVFNWLSR